MRLIIGALCGLWAGLPAAAQGATPAPVPVAFSQLAVQDRPGAPTYPPLARTANLQGVVLLRLTLDAKGQVERAQAVDGPPLLREAAEAFLLAWRFQPVVLEGRPARVQCDLQVPFRLTDRGASPVAAPPTKVVIQIEQEPREGPTVLEAGQLQSEVQAWLARSGLEQVAASEAGPLDTFHVRLEVKRIWTEREVYVCQTLARCSLWADRELDQNEPGQPRRMERLGHMVGQQGDAGFQELLRATARRTLDDLLAPPPRPAAPAAPDKRPVDPSPPGAHRAPGDARTVDFDFSQIRVLYQPPAPPYPPAAKSRRVQGTVVVELVVGPEGRVRQAEAVEGPDPLRLTAIGYALAWRFQPALLNGLPQYARFRLTMPFRLR